MASNMPDFIEAGNLPPMMESELLANTTFLVVDGNGKLKQIIRSALYNSISSIVAKGDKGDTGATGATGQTGAKGNKGDKGDKGDTGATGSQGSNGQNGIDGVDGDDGWSPIYALVARGDDLVIQITDWVNPNPSALNKPNFPVYISLTGFTTNINNAVNIKGSKGDKGDKGDTGNTGATGNTGVNGNDGWSPIIKLKEEDDKLYFYLEDWVNGTGVKPITFGFISSDGITETPVDGSDIMSLPVTISFADITDKPTTISGYGVTDVYTKTETDNLISNIEYPVTSVNTKTGSVVLNKTDIGLSNVDNTSDENKPISTAMQTALDEKVDVVSGKQLSTEDFSTSEKNKLSDIEIEATKNESDTYLLNRGNHTGTQDVTTIDGISDVGISGDYEDLINKPNIPTFYTGDGSPEGIVNADIPSIYIDNLNGNIYTKTSNSSDTDWKIVTIT